MAIDIVDLPIEKGDVPYLCKRLPEGIQCGVGYGYCERLRIDWITLLAVAQSGTGPMAGHFWIPSYS